MLTGELADKLEPLGTMVVVIMTEDRKYLIHMRITQIISPREHWDSLIEAHTTGTPKTAVQAARELRRLARNGTAQLAYIDDAALATYVYFDIGKIIPDYDTHTVAIHTGDFRTG
jgi:hypothetical protein